MHIGPEQAECQSPSIYCCCFLPSSYYTVSGKNVLPYCNDNFV